MVTFLGDVVPQRPFSLEADLPGLLVLNLEAPLTDHRVGYPGKINLRGSAGAFEATFAHRKAVVTLANNHVMDFHEPGLSDTLTAIDRLGFSYCGVGTAGDGWRNPAVVDVGLRLAVLAYADASSSPVFASETSPGAASLSLERVVADIAAARAAGAERVAVVVHWGEEQVHMPTLRCVNLARAFVDAGADAVVGHHAHCIQSFETYRGKPVMYGLGNCAFAGHRSPSFYDAEGRPTRLVEARPAPRNLRSLALVWDPLSGAFEVRPLRFDGNRLTRTRLDLRRFALRLNSAEAYEAAYARAFAWGKLRHTVHSFATRPKLPRLAHLRSVGRLLRTAARS